MSYTMKEMVGYINVSNTTLKKYEKFGLIPSVPYTKGRHRRYEDIHLMAFRTIRQLLNGFDIKTAYKLMTLAIEKRFTEAHWLITDTQKKLANKKETLKIHKDFLLTFHQNPIKQKEMRIGQLAAFANLQSSTIRYWEKETSFKVEDLNQVAIAFMIKMRCVKLLLFPTYGKIFIVLKKLKRLLIQYTKKILIVLESITIQPIEN
ncbi:MerR family transcriptional regulator [Staphylococcus nepalensis]